MVNVAIICRKPEQFRNYVLGSVAINIGDIYITRERVDSNDFTYWMITDLQSAQGVLWGYYRIVGPMGSSQEEVATAMATMGVPYFGELK